MVRQLIAGLAVSATAFLATPAFANSYCDGFQAGYKAGYCYRKYSCIPPLPPLCPLPRLGESTFQDGYNRGFTLGVANQ